MRGDPCEYTQTSLIPVARGLLKVYRTAPLSPPLARPPFFMFKNIPFNRVDWTTSIFLIGTLFLSLTAVPAYIWFFGLDWFQVAMFLFFFAACGFSITLGYHRM